MTIKSFNVEDEIYNRFLRHCKERGLSMSKQIEFFMQSVVEEEPKVKKEYIDKINRIRKQKSTHIGGLEGFRKRYGLE